MKTILVPTDFSDVARNAAMYAIQLANQLHARKLIFYNAYLVPPVIGEPAAMPVIPIIDMQTITSISAENLEKFTNSLSSYFPAGLVIEQKSGYSDLTDDIEEVCESTGADVIVFGITNTSKLEEVLVGSTAISVVKNTKVPVIIVPSEASFTSINSVALACDFKDVAATTPIHYIKSLLDSTDATLHVLNVYENVNEVSDEKAHEKELLTTLLQEYEPVFHFVQNEDFITGINDFVDANEINMIITIPKKHGFLQGLFRERHTKILAFHSHVPMMFIHEQNL